MGQKYFSQQLFLAFGILLKLVLQDSVIVNPFINYSFCPPIIGVLHLMVVRLVECEAMKGLTDQLLLRNLTFPAVFKILSAPRMKAFIMLT